jgi:hypothetical protein
MELTSPFRQPPDVSIGNEGCVGCQSASFETCRWYPFFHLSSLLRTFIFLEYSLSISSILSWGRFTGDRAYWMINWNIWGLNSKEWDYQKLYTQLPNFRRKDIQPVNCILFSSLYIVSLIEKNTNRKMIWVEEIKHNGEWRGEVEYMFEGML